MFKKLEGLEGLEELEEFEGFEVQRVRGETFHCETLCCGTIAVAIC